MDWTIQDLGALGEFVGAIAVVVTLAYLAIQIRQAKTVLAESARSSRLQSEMDVLLATAGESIWAAGMEKIYSIEGVDEGMATVSYLTDKYDFSISEALRMVTWCYAWLKRQEHAFLQPLDKGERQMMDSQVSNWLALTVPALFWKLEDKSWFD